MAAIGFLFVCVLGFVIAAFALAKFVLLLVAAVLFVVMLGAVQTITNINQEKQRIYWESQRSERTLQYMHRPCWMRDSHTDAHTEINSRNNITVTTFHNCTFHNCNFYLNSDGNTDRHTPALPERAAQTALPNDARYPAMPATTQNYIEALPYGEYEKR